MWTLHSGAAVLLVPQSNILTQNSEDGQKNSGDVRKFLWDTKAFEMFSG